MILQQSHDQHQLLVQIKSLRTIILDHLYCSGPWENSNNKSEWQYWSLIEYGNIYGLHSKLIRNYQGSSYKECIVRSINKYINLDKVQDQNSSNNTKYITRFLNDKKIQRRNSSRIVDKKYLISGDTTKESLEEEKTITDILDNVSVLLNKYEQKYLISQQMALSTQNQVLFYII